MTRPPVWAWLVVAAAASIGIAAAVVVVAAPARETGPVREALGLEEAGRSPADAAALDRRRAVEVARRTTECMAAAGFAYIARPESPPPVPDGDLDPLAWAQRWGFGISTSVGMAVVLAPLERPATIPPAAAEALYGSGHGPGCHDRARTDVYGLRDRLLEPLAPALSGLQATIDADPAMGAVLARWSRCAAAATGAAVSDRGAIGTTVLAAFAARASAVPDRAALTRLQAEERRVAAGLAVCESAYVDGRRAVARPHEASFVLAHRPALAAAGAAIRAAEAGYPPDPGP